MDDNARMCIVDLRQNETFTIDGLIDLHAEHGNDIEALVTAAQMAYVHGQFHRDVTEIHTQDRRALQRGEWSARRITLIPS